MIYLEFRKYEIEMIRYNKCLNGEHEPIELYASVVKAIESIVVFKIFYPIKYSEYNK